MEQGLEKWRVKMGASTSVICMGKLLLPNLSFSSRHLYFLTSCLHILGAEGLSHFCEKGYLILQIDPIFSSPLVQQFGNSASGFKLVYLIYVSMNTVRKYN